MLLGELCVKSGPVQSTGKDQNSQACVCMSVHTCVRSCEWPRVLACVCREAGGANGLCLPTSCCCICQENRGRQEQGYIQPMET